MKKQPNTLTSSALLRQKAEELLKKRPSGKELAFSESDLLKLDNELEVHQIELEMQNEELILAKEKAELSEKKYLELYDFAPSGYFTLTDLGDIAEINLTTAKIIGRPRSKLINSRFSLFVSEDTRAVFNQFLKNTFDSTRTVTCEVKLALDSGIPVYVLLNGIVADNERQCNVTMTVITDRVLVEEALKESEAKFRSLFSEMSEGVYLHEMVYNHKGAAVDYRIIETNASSEKHLNIKFEDAVGKLATDLYGTNEAPYLDNYEKVVNTGVPYHFEAYFQPLKKHFHISVYSPAKGKFATIFSDITERKMAQDELKEKEHSLRTLFNAMSDVVFELDYDGRYINIAPTSPELLFRSPEDILGKSLHEIFPKPEADLFLEFVRKCLNENKMITMEYPLVLQGKTFWFEGRAVPKTRNSVLCIASDITERRQAKEELQRSDEKHRILFENAGDAIFIHDFNSPAILAVNQQACKQLGYSRAELLSMPANAVDTPEQSRYMPERIAGLKEKGHLVFETEHQRKDGSIVSVEVTAQMIMWDGQSAIMSISRDITERRQAEAQIIEKNLQLQKLNAEKDRFFSIISHDLKSPFNSIVGFSSLLVEQAREKNFAGIEKFAGIIEQSSNRAMELLVNLLEWSRSQTGRMEFNPEYFDLISLINQTILLYGEIAKQKQITILSTLPASVIAFADKTMIGTVLRNLISNAIKFTWPGGKISITAEENGDELKVSINDTGVGISKSSMEKLFSLEEKYSTPGTNKEQGTGLGLILCKDFVEKQKGRIWVESEEGTGSTFYFTIPLHPLSKE